MGTRYRNLSPGATFFVTTTAAKFFNICINDTCYAIIIDAIKLSLVKHNLKLLAYVIMPNHIHLVLSGSGDSISNFMRDFKRASSVRIRREFERSFPEHKQIFRYDKKGKKGYKIWMDRFDSVVVFSESVMKTKIKYILQNPVRKGLATSIFDWPYSSAINYLNPSKACLPIEKINLDLT